MRLSDYYLALITGATSKLGSSLAYLLSQKGIPLILTGRNADELKKLEATLPETKTAVADLSTPEGIYTVSGLIRKFKPNLVINNAGIGLYGPALSHTIKENIDIFEVNARATIELTLSAVEMLDAEERYGTILNVSSAAAFFPYPNFAAYAASKAAINHFSAALSHELREKNIHILTASPGQIATDFRKNASKGHSPRPSPLAISPLRAARRLLSQIEKDKRHAIFPLTTKLALFFFRLLPKKMAILQKTVSTRFPLLQDEYH